MPSTGGGDDRVAQLIEWHVPRSRDPKQRQAALLASAEAHRDAAQVAVFAGDELTAARHVRAALRDEDAATRLASTPQL